MADLSCHADHSMPWPSVDHKTASAARSHRHHAKGLYTPTSADPLLAERGTVRIILDHDARADPAFQFASHQIVTPDPQVGSGVHSSFADHDDSLHTDTSPD